MTLKVSQHAAHPQRHTPAEERAASTAACGSRTTPFWARSTPASSRTSRASRRRWRAAPRGSTRGSGSSGTARGRCTGPTSTGRGPGPGCGRFPLFTGGYPFLVVERACVFCVGAFLRDFWGGSPCPQMRDGRLVFDAFGDRWSKQTFLLCAPDNPRKRPGPFRRGFALGGARLTSARPGAPSPKVPERRLRGRVHHLLRTRRQGCAYPAYPPTPHLPPTHTPCPPVSARGNVRAGRRSAAGFNHDLPPRGLPRISRARRQPGAQTCHSLFVM